MRAKTWLIAAGATVALSGAAYAAGFQDTCVAGGSGMFQSKHCACFEKSASEGEKKDLLRYFELQTLLPQAKAPATQATSDEMQKGAAVLQKHATACMSS